MTFKLCLLFADFYTLHQELAEPSIKDAFSLCVQQGAKRVVVSPFFLFPGRHWHTVWLCSSQLFCFLEASSFSYLWDYWRMYINGLVRS